MQDFRDAVAPVFGPAFVALNVAPWVLVSVIPSSLVASVMIAARDKPIVDVIRGVDRDQWMKLGLCILLDFLGDANEFLPPGIVKTLADIGFGPLDYILLSRLFASRIIPVLGLLEESLPGTDALPLATIAWAIETFATSSNLARVLGLDASSSSSEKEDLVLSDDNNSRSSSRRP